MILWKQRDSSRRYQSAAGLRDDLRRFLASRPIVARRAGMGLRLARFISRHQVASVAAAAIVVAAGLTWAVRVNQKKAASERAVAATATAAAVEAQEVNELLLNFVSLVQGGPASLAEAAIPLNIGKKIFDEIARNIRKSSN